MHGEDESFVFACHGGRKGTLDDGIGIRVRMTQDDVIDPTVHFTGLFQAIQPNGVTPSQIGR